MSTDHLSPRNRAAALACIIISCKLLLRVHAFTPQSKQIYIVHRHQHLSKNHHIISLDASIDDDSEENDTSYDDNENSELLNELRDKKKAFGKDLPINDEFQQAAKDSENAFLAAMLEESQNFKEIKSEKGSDAAVSEFRQRIQEGDESQRLEDATNNAASEEGLMDKKWFVQQMEEGMEETEEENDDDAWQ